MIRVVESIEIQRPVEAVFGLIADFRRMPEWRGMCVGARLEDEGGVATGTRVTVTEKFLANRFDVPLVVTEYAPPRVLAMRSGEGGPFQVENRIELIPTALGTRLTGTFTGDTASFYKMAEPVLKRSFRANVRKDLSGLKRILESEVSVTV